MSFWSNIEQKISASIGESFCLKNHLNIAGGDINQAMRLEGVVAENKAISFFIKLNQKHMLDMFEAEAAGLEEIKKAQVIQVPHVVCSGVAENQSYLVLENLALGGGVSGSASLFGQQLALMHKVTSEQFGWSRNNTIGSTKQVNDRRANWIDFWRDQRLGFQLDLAKKMEQVDLYAKKVRR